MTWRETQGDRLAPPLSPHWLLCPAKLGKSQTSFRRGRNAGGHKISINPHPNPNPNLRLHQNICSDAAFVSRHQESSFILSSVHDSGTFLLRE